MLSFRTSVKAAETVGTGWMLGIGLFTSFRFVLYLAGLPSGVADVVSLLIASPAIVVGFRMLWRVRRMEVSGNDGVPAIVLGGLGMAGMQVALAAWTSLNSPMYAWDAWAQWGFKARMFALGGPPTSFFQADRTLYANPSYPLNLPIAESPFFRLPDVWAMHIAGLIGVGFFVALLALFYAGFTRLYGVNVAAIGTAALAWIPSLAIQAANGNADLPVGSYLGAASLYLLLWWRFRRSEDAILMGLFAGGAAWTKHEGFEVALALVAIYALVELTNRSAHLTRRLRLAARGVISFLLLPVPWLLFAHITHPRTQGEFSLSVTTLQFNLARLPTIGMYLEQQLINIHNWSLLWILLGVVLLLGCRRLSFASLGLLVLLITQIAVYMSAYVFTTLPYVAEILVSIDRLLLQAVPLAFLILIDSVQTLVGRPDIASHPPAFASTLGSSPQHLESQGRRTLRRKAKVH